MAKTFNSLKNTSLQLTDKLTFGKFKDCRICDVVETDWEYLKWLSQNTKVNFSKSVLDAISAKWNAFAEQQHYEEEIAPWVAEGREITVDDLFASVPKTRTNTYGKASLALRGNNFDIVIFDDLDDVPF